MDTCIVCGNKLENWRCPCCGYSETADTNPHHLPAGTRLSEGKYTIGNVVGAGGFGVVYAAWDNNLQIKLAIKEYMPGEFSTRMPGVTSLTIYGGEKSELFTDGMNKFFDESHRLSKFTEVPGIVQIYDCFHENNTAYIVMEFLEGKTLEQLIKEQGRIPVQKAVDIIATVLDTLDVVHHEGIIHRDIAPNNIFITDQDQVKLLDFGSARGTVGIRSRSLTVSFKDGYTAEEQYSSRGEQGPWTDVYATAASLYKAITGETPEGALDRRVDDRLKPPSKLGIKLSSNVDKAIMNALNVSVKKRTQSAADFREELTGEKKARKKYKREAEKNTAKIPLFVWIISGAGMIAIFILLLMMSFGMIDFHAETFSNLFVAEDKVRVMNVVNMDVSEAEERLEKLGLKIVITEYKIDNSVKKGRIISQEEKKGSIVDKGSTVHVIVSSEYNYVATPADESSPAVDEEDNEIIDDTDLVITPTGKDDSKPTSAVFSPTPTKYIEPTSSQERTATPTTAPAVAPVSTPTPVPTATPTPRPTAVPTVPATDTPTPAESSNPTTAPESNPTATPTPSPTLAPTATPTPEPTLEPTATPTPEPTLAPTATPTPQFDPTATPSPVPDFVPTATPTPVPDE